MTNRANESPSRSEMTGLLITMVVIFLLGLAIQGLGMLFRGAGEQVLVRDIPLHSALEIGGSAIAAMVAYVLLRLDAVGEGSSFNCRIAAALLAMGCLDGLHAMLRDGESFVWLHSLATFLGGLLFATVWLPAYSLKPVRKYLPYAAAVFALALGASALVYPGQVPQMIEAGRFTQTAVTMHHAGGLFFVLAAIKLFLTYRHTRKTEDMLFFFQCIILASAALMFQYSGLWDVPWWGWHVQRLAGYALTLWLVVRTANTIEAKTLLNNQLLQEQIEERKRIEAELRIAAVAFESRESMMITDANTVILRVNHAFTESTGYPAEEAVGQTPRLLQSGRHDAEFYRKMWEIIRQTGTWQGEIWDRRKNGEIYPKWLMISSVKGEDGVVTHYVGSHVDISERKRAEDEIKYLAFYDPLTGLPNRRLLVDRLRQTTASSARDNSHAGLLFVDLDNFKTLNDTLGHNMGDLLLQQVGLRLVSCVREGDTVARQGGDEFVVMLESLSEQEVEAAAEIETVGEKILAALDRPYRLATHDYRSTPSIGATLFRGHQRSVEELLKQADIAMYQAKKAGRNTMRFFDQAMQDAVTSRVELGNELRQAIEKQQFRLYYQIQVDKSGLPIGAEGLVRWEHPERGLVRPDQFIPLAEETGLVLPLGRWVRETACAKIKEWQDTPFTANFVLSVNISAKEFRQKDFVDQIQADVRRYAINPKQLKLELTESMLLENIEETVARMNALKEIGVQISLDDFGTGYSSLQYLKQLPLSQLKIDQSFVRELATSASDQAIVTTIVSMAKGLDLDVIAEGVETAEQKQFLLGIGCNYFQGYLFSKPLPGEQFEHLLKQY